MGAPLTNRLPGFRAGSADRREILLLSLQLSRLKRAAWWVGRGNAMVDRRADVLQRVLLRHWSKLPVQERRRVKARWVHCRT
jgi:hypothetical protein